MRIITAIILAVSLLQTVASSTVFGVFEVPPSFDPNMVRGEIIAVKTVKVGEQTSLCIQGQDPDGVQFVPISIPSGMVLEETEETPDKTIVRYTWELDRDDIGLHYIVLGFEDKHEIPMATEATVVIEVLPPDPPPNEGPPLVMLCP